MRRINIYFRNPPLGYKWVPGDRYIIYWLRRLLQGKKISGLEKVFINLCKGFDELNINHVKNPPFKKILPGEPVIILGIGKYALQDYKQPNPIIAGIGLMTHPAEWPDLFKEYPVAKYLQHSAWTNCIYKVHYGADKCELWPAGIDTERWAPTAVTKRYDVLVYKKIMWDKANTERALIHPILRALDTMGITWHEITYGQYTEAEYHNALRYSRAMIFLCEHESQGFACCEALSMNVPVFAWDQGWWLDPNRFKWNNPMVSATSIPCFDENCGMAFIDYNDFENKIDQFWQKAKAGMFKPREYILKNLTLQKSAERMLELINSVYK